MVPARLRRLEVRELPGGLRLFRAGSVWSRLLGLALLPALPRGCAVLLPRCRSVHTFGMRFPVDVVFLDARGEVVRVERAVAPGRVVSCWRARAAVEMSSGQAAWFLRVAGPAWRADARRR